MKTFRNVNYVKGRYHNCASVIACQAEQAPDANWVECEESFLHNLTQLYIQAGVRYFGRL